MSQPSKPTESGQPKESSLSEAFRKKHSLIFVNLGPNVSKGWAKQKREQEAQAQEKLRQAPPASPREQ